jgi:hypothetical protein
LKYNSYVNSQSINTKEKDLNMIENLINSTSLENIRRIYGYEKLISLISKDRISSFAVLEGHLQGGVLKSQHVVTDGMCVHVCVYTYVYYILYIYIYIYIFIYIYLCIYIYVYTYV